MDKGPNIGVKQRSMEEGSERAAEERKAAIPTSRTDFESGGPSPGFREAAVVVEVGEETINTVNTLPTSPAAAGAGAVTSSDDQIIDTTNRFRYSVVNPRLRPLKPKSTLKECRKWVSCANQDHRECRSSEYQLKKKQWHSGTCTWLLREPEYVNWRDRIPGISNILVVQGNNGFGKSVLATWVIGNLCGPATSDLRQPRNKPIVLDFFFRNGRSFAESTEDMARSLADQLLIHSGGPKQCVDVDERCIRVIDNLRQSGQRATFQNAWTAFQDMAKVIERPIYIVIDAIDECSPAFRTELLDAFQNLDCRGLGIHLLMTSRPEYSLTDVINQWPSLDFSNSAVKADIHLYLTSRLVHQKYITLRPYREKVVKVLSQQAGGMFQYAALMLEELRYLPSDKDVKKVLSQPPRDLHAAYSWILGHRLDPRLLWLRKVIFTWLLHKFKNTEGNSARAPVSVSEIVSIMSFPLAPEHPSHPILGSSDTLPPPHRIRVNIDQIRRACGPLIDIRDSNGRGGDCVLSFSHNSVGAFLKMTPTELKQHIKMRETDALPNAVLECLVGEREAHISMTLSCISQLTSSSTTAGDWIHPRPCFLEYSARYWLYHARIAQSMPDQDSLAPFWEAITRFILSCCTWPKDTIHKAARTRDPEGNPWNESFHHYWPWLLTKTTEPIDLAVISGLKAPVQNLSERPGVPLIPEHVHLSIATMGQPQFIQTLLTHTNIGNFNCPFQDNRLINAMQEAVKTESQLPYNAHHFMNFERVINNTTAQPTLIKRLVRNHASHLGLTPLAITGLGHPRESPAGSVERILNTSRCLMRHMPRTEKTLMEYLRILPDYLATHPINIDTITSVINHIPNFNLLDGDTGMSILGIMCLKGPLDVSIFTQILQRCPPKMIKQKDKMGATPLMHLVCDRKQEYGHGVECQRRMEVMRMLISRGATVHESMYKADRRVSSMYEELERRNSRHRTPVGADGSGGGTARGCASCMELRRLLVSAAGEGNKRSLNPSKWFCC
ncbi:hypothetical protein DFH27DRAFT_281941 [Peziza echinospora]|nr:hypothetical protein DFH27DRAFT_281941 [Peziza echinospora]